MRSVALILLCSLFTLNLQAQLASTPPLGPRGLGMGSITVTQQDQWSVFNNPAGLTDLKETSALFGYRSILDFAPFNTVSAGVVLPAQFGTAGVSVYRFGDELFNSQMLSGVISKKLGIVGLGIKASYLQFNVEGFGRRAVFIADIGAVAQLSPEITFGAHISNFTQSSISNETNERVPTTIRLGLKYSPISSLSLLVEGEKDVDLTTDLKFGIEYQIIEKVKMRTGFTTETNTHSFGAGIKLNRFEIDYGIRINRFLGNNHNLGLVYTFPPK